MSGKVPNRDPLHRKYRELKLIAKGLLFTEHPVVAHVIPIRRCNLACGYCNEFDDYSKPVPVEVMKDRIDYLARLGLSALVFSGGEPLLHPQLEELVAHARSSGLLVGLITNGYLLTVDRIQKLNAAGLDYMQISIDNIEPDEVSVKSLKVLDKKLRMLYEHATFGVNINSVIGGGVRNPEDALTIGKRAVELGFSTTVGIIHDGRGQLTKLSVLEQRVFEQLRRMGKTSYARFNKFQDNLAAGKPNDWRCRAGSRYLYVCEDGLVHYCSQRRGYPGVPLSEYTREDIRREYYTKKDCAPFCTVACVHKVATLDNWRNPQTLPDPAAGLEAAPQLVQLRRSALTPGKVKKKLQVVNAE
ncbi:MAG: radical SAM protein [Acidobacteriota bacterium]|nr:radical SAM protein [Blastocatellia bacterium]MDW8413000.1 radical SAM protein [Acidobacteriota bacterium]